MATVLREDTSLEAQTDARHTNDQTLVRRLGDAAPPTPDAEPDELPIAKWLLSQERAATKPPAPQPTSASASAAAGHGAQMLRAQGCAEAAPATRGLPIAVLTNDALFAGQVRAALETRHDVSIIDNAEAVTVLAQAHRCPILVTDAALTRAAVEALTARIRAHDPDAAIVVSGNRDQGGMLISLQSSGAIDGFLLKPVTTAATQLVIDAATRRYRSHELPISSETRVRARTRPPRTQRPRSAATPAAVIETPTIEVKCESKQPVAVAQQPPTLRRTSIPRASWPLVAIVALAVAASTWWAMSQRQPTFSPQELIDKHLVLAEQAKAARRLLDPRDGAVHHYQAALAIDPHNLAALRGLDRVAFELSKESQTHMSNRRIADAAVTLSSLRELQPDYPELPLLDRQLQQLQELLAQENATAKINEAAKITAPPAPAEQRPNTARTEPTARARPTPIPEKLAVPNEASPAPAVPVAVTAPVAPQEPPVVATTSPTAESAITTPPSAASSTPVEQPSIAAASPKLVHYVAPEYPKEARIGGAEGWVILSVRLSANGTVIDARIESAENRSLFGKPALAAVKRWRYEPGTFSTERDARVTVKVNFRLDS